MFSARLVDEDIMNALKYGVESHIYQTTVSNDSLQCGFVQCKHYFFFFLDSVQTHHPSESSSSWAQRMMTLSMSLMTSLLSWMSSLLEMAGPLNGERLPGQEAINESDVKPDIINVCYCNC